MARYGVIHANLLFEIMVSSYCIVFRGAHKCKTVTALNINHGLFFSNPGSYKPGLVHCSKTQTKPHQNRGSDQVYTDQVSAWFNGGLNHGLDHCSKIGPLSFFFRGHVGPLHKIQGYQGHLNVSKCSPHLKTNFS